jgi:universal stress protein A
MGMDVQKILVPIDFSEHSRQALHWGGSLAERYGAHLLVLHVIPQAVEEAATHGSTAEQLIIDLTAKVEAQLYDITGKELQKRLPVRMKVAVGKPADEILRVAREEGVDLIVMGTHARTGLGHLLLGSTAETVVRTAPCPVFTVRAGIQATP